MNGLVDLDAAKQDLRRSMVKWRAALSTEVAAKAMSALVVSFQPLLTKLSFSIVSSYIPIRSEIDPSALFISLLRPGITGALPVVLSRDEALMFRAWQPRNQLETGPFGTRHPHPSHQIVVPDLLLVPLLAFDRRCHRLGYGAGHYDRTLALLREKRSVMAIGVAFAGQEVEAVPVGAWDQPLDIVVTEHGIVE